MDYELIRPSSEIVDQFNAFWNGASSNRPMNWQIRLFKNQEKVDIREYISENSFKKMREDDEDIRNADSIRSKLKKINAIYSTRINAEYIAQELTPEKLKSMTLDDFVQYCYKKTGKYSYSFATKVFSFIKDDREYPIFDSNVVTLLAHYLEEEGRHPQKKSWGNYAEFQKAYKEYVDLFGLQKYSYKQIDIFLWTYGKAIQQYWKKNGVLTFESVQYIPRKDQ